MNRYFNSATTSTLVSGNAPSQNGCMFWGYNTRRAGGFGKLTALPSGYGNPNDGLAPAAAAGAISSKVFANGYGALTLSLAAGRGIAGQSAGLGEVSSDITGLGWGLGTSTNSSTANVTAFGLGLIKGSIAGTSAATSGIFAAVSIQGTAEGLSEVTGTGYLALTGSGQANGSSTATISLAALLSISGTASGSSAVDGVLIGGYFTSGLAEGSCTVEGAQPLGEGWIAGIAVGNADGVANPYAQGFMTGTTLVAGGELTADSIAVAVWNYEQ